MKIILEGIEEQFRPILKTAIEAVVQEVFPEDTSIIDKIIVPINFIEEVKNQHKIDHEYDYSFLENGQVNGKTFYRNGKSVILLRGSEFHIDQWGEQYEEYPQELSLIYHELMHVCLIKEVWEKNNWLLSEFPISGFWIKKSLNLVDEYHAVKRTTMFFQTCQLQYLAHLEQMLNCSYIAELRNSIKSESKNEEFTIHIFEQYMSSLLTWFITSCAMIDSIPESSSSISQELVITFNKIIDESYQAEILTKIHRQIKNNKELQDRNGDEIKENLIEIGKLIESAYARFDEFCFYAL